MKTIVLVASLLGLVGCTEEADIGIDSQPVSCMTDGTSAGDMTGTVHYGGETYDFDNAIPSLFRDPDGPYTTLSLWNTDDPSTQRGNALRFTFQCGATDVASYDVVSGTSQQLICPFEVGAAVLGSIEILPVDTGTLIIDETSGCFAGRFHVEMDNEAGDGSLAGWFSIPQ